MKCVSLLVCVASGKIESVNDCVHILHFCY